METKSSSAIWSGEKERPNPPPPSLAATLFFSYRFKKKGEHVDQFSKSRRDAATGSSLRHGVLCEASQQRRRTAPRRISDAAKGKKRRLERQKFDSNYCFSCLLLLSVPSQERIIPEKNGTAREFMKFFVFFFSFNTDYGL